MRSPIYFYVDPDGPIRIPLISDIWSSVCVFFLKTSGFWPRVRARALRAPVFLSSLTCKAGRCSPSLAPCSFAAPVFITLTVYYEELSSFRHLVERTK